jgi:hypothetical protein
VLDVAFIAHLIRVTLTGAPFPAVGRAIPLLMGMSLIYIELLVDL